MKQAATVSWLVVILSYFFVPVRPLESVKGALIFYPHDMHHSSLMRTD